MGTRACEGIALKVDVDTLQGLTTGVPALLPLFREMGISATFFVACGPDHSGRAIRRLLRPGFLAKMWRMGPLKTYGLRTLLSGTLLPAPLIGERAPEIFREIAAEGHEVGIHGYDHVLWQDGVHRMGAAAVAEELRRAIRVYERVLGRRPQASAAPGWQCTAESLQAQEEEGFTYCSDVRGTTPFFPRAGGRVFRTLQIPTTLPTMDEILGLPGISPSTYGEVMRRTITPDRLHVHTIHAEVEGGRWLDLFAEFLSSTIKEGVRYRRLCDVAADLLRSPASLPTCSLSYRSVIGRSGLVACQSE